MKSIRTDPQSIRAIAVALAAFVSLLLLGNRLHLLLCESVIDTPCVPSWPISEMVLRGVAEFNAPTLADFAIAGVALLVFIFGLWTLEKRRYPIGLVAAFGLMLILLTTLTHGVQGGLERPVTGLGLTKAEYTSAAAQIVDPITFLRDFEQMQPTLLGHSGTHPPGAVLLFYLLQRLLGHPVLISLAITLSAVGLTALTFRALLSDQLAGAAAGRALFLLFLLPAVQIYFAASLDAVITPLMVGSVLWVTSPTRPRLAAATVCLILVSMLTFNFLFVLPVLAAMAWMKRGGTRGVLLQLGVLALFWLLVQALVGYNVVHSFAIAARLENPAGFRLLSTPGDYGMTRVEDVGEIVLFLGPSALLAIAQGVRSAGTRDNLVRLSAAAIGSLLLVFLTGAYRTGETARAAMFIYPFLLLPAVRGLAQPDAAGRYRLMAILTFAQALLMQLAGDFFW